jgi:hypothetical protein
MWKVVAVLIFMSTSASAWAGGTLLAAAALTDRDANQLMALGISTFALAATFPEKDMNEVDVAGFAKYMKSIDVDGFRVLCYLKHAETAGVSRALSHIINSGTARGISVEASRKRIVDFFAIFIGAKDKNAVARDTETFMTALNKRLKEAMSFDKDAQIACRPSDPGPDRVCCNP